MGLTEKELEELREYLKDILQDPVTKRMEQYMQHGTVSTYDHCRRVARASFFLNRRLHLKADEHALAVGAMLHDLYLYDWHHHERTERLPHGFTHAAESLRNARKYFRIGLIEQEIIRTHMWPLNLTAVPTCREALIVCLADKYCSLKETLFMRN